MTKYLALLTIIALALCLWLANSMGKEKAKRLEAEQAAAALVLNAQKLQAAIAFRSAEADKLRVQNATLRKSYAALNQQITEWRSQPLPAALVEFLHHSTATDSANLPPVDVTSACPVPIFNGKTNGDLSDWSVEAITAIQACNADKAAIRQFCQ